jgi:hypothetical protein
MDNDFVAYPEASNEWENFKAGTLDTPRSGTGMKV